MQVREMACRQDWNSKHVSQVVLDRYSVSEEGEKHRRKDWRKLVLKRILEKSKRSECPRSLPLNFLHAPSPVLPVLFNKRTS